MTTHMNYRKEHIIYTSIWLLLYISPLGSLYMRMSSNPDISFHGMKFSMHGSLIPSGLC